MTTHDLGEAPADITISGAQLAQVGPDRIALTVAGNPGEVTITTDGFPTVRFVGGMLFMQGIKPYLTSSGTRGDVVIPNHHASFRAVLSNGLGTTPLVKLTKNDTPVFGRFPIELPNNEAVYIGAPHGLLVVTNATTGYSALFMISAGAGQIGKLSDPWAQFSTVDAQAGRIVVIWDPVAASYQIQNRIGTMQAVGWAAYGAL